MYVLAHNMTAAVLWKTIKETLHKCQRCCSYMHLRETEAGYVKYSHELTNIKNASLKETIQPIIQEIIHKPANKVT